MDVRIDEKGSSQVAVIEGGVLINSVQDALDLMATIQYEYGCHKAVLPKTAFAERFFDLKTRLAGDILQKFTNYRFKAAVTGDFSVYGSKSLRDFIYESNNGEQVFFLPDTAAALQRLHNL